MAGKFPESFTDPVYAQADAANEQKLGIPVGLLSSIRTAGEKSNASQTSSAGAITPYQFIPATRRAILDKYGIDVTLSPENASEGAGLLLQESLKRSNGDVETAVRQYHGGTDPKNWGKVNDAYAGRVLAAQGAAKTDALGAGFAKFMADNPAIPAASAPAAATPPATDALGAGFGQWLAQKNAPPVTSADIPNEIGSTPESRAPTGPQADPTLVDKLIGGGEAALTLATGATTGAAGMLMGGVQGLVGNLTGGAVGDPAGVEAGMQHGAERWTYAPRTDSGQEQAGAVGNVLVNTLPMIPLAAEMGAIGRSAGQAARGAGEIAAAGVNRIRAAAPAIADRVERILRRNPDPAPTPTPGTRGSAGAAATDAANQRTALANDLPVPIPLTEGQATRSPDQLRFELETAKGDKGAPLRERYSEQNERIQKNFDAWVDQTGAEAPDLRAVGKTVDEALVKKSKRDKTEINVAYAKARQAGELEQPVVLKDLVDYLNESAPDAATAPLLDVARKRAIQLGIATVDDSGNLVAAGATQQLPYGWPRGSLPPGGVTLRQAETFRQAINRATNYDAPNIRQSTIIKGLVDSATEGKGGALYQSARRLRENYAKQYETRAVINDLLRPTKNGMTDRKVTFEDVFDHSILKGDMDDVRHLRRVLQTGGEQGQQAWKELQGQTVNWLKSEATKNVATDQRSNRIVSAAQLDKAIRKLDSDGKLDFVFGKSGAQQMRDINDLAKVVMTAPPGVVNTSNTASVLMAALAEAGVTGSMVGLPVPVISGMRMIAKQVQDRKLRARIEHALNAPQRRRGPPPAP